MLNIHPRTALQNSVLLVFVALVTLLPSLHFMPKVIIWFMDGQRLLELLLLSLILLDATLIGRKQNNLMMSKLVPINNKLHYAFLVLLGLATISAYLAQSPRHAVVELSTFAGLCYLAIFVARLYHENHEVFTKRLTYALWASILLYMASFYVGYITATIFKTPLHWPFPFTGFSNIRSFNQYQLWSLGFICLPLLVFEPKSGRTRSWLHLALTFWWVLLFYSASRGVLIAWLAGILITAALYQKIAWPFLRLQLIHIVTGFLSYYILFTSIPTIHNSTLVTGTVIRETTDDRFALWSQAITLVQNYPIFGVGPMNYAWYSPTNAHPHNSVLQLASEWGLPATLIILTISGYGIYYWLKKFNANSLKTKPRLDSNLAIILLFTIITNAAYSLVDGVIVMPISQVLMFTMIGLMVGQYAYGDLTVTKDNSRFRPVFAGVVLLAMVWSTFPEISRGLSGYEKGFSMGYTAIGPRFWKEIQ